MTLQYVAGNSSVPQGAILMWSGEPTDIPDGFTLCDGTEGAPDLQDRFVVGAGGTYSPGDTGGEESHTLTEDELPSHSHGIPTDVDGSSAPSPGGYSAGGANYGSTQNTNETGGDAAHENRPPYYAVSYIMKT